MIFFTSDHHFGHANIIKYCARPFASVEEMNETMIRKWNEVVRPEDTVFYLGDFALSKNLVESVAGQLNGEKYLIMGNHDVCHPTHKKKAEEGLQIYQAAGFKNICLEMMLDVAGSKVVLNHMPYLDEEPKAEYKLRYQNYRPKNQGQWLIHGHVHEKWKLKDKMLNVGVDVWNFYPAPLTEIEKIIRST